MPSSWRQLRPRLPAWALCPGSQPSGQGLEPLGGVGSGPGWATAHFLGPCLITSKATGGPVVTPWLPRSRRGGPLTNPGSWVLPPAASKQLGWAALWLVLIPRGGWGTGKGDNGAFSASSSSPPHCLPGWALSWRRGCLGVVNAFMSV